MTTVEPAPIFAGPDEATLADAGITVTPLAGALGAEIGGVTVTDLDDDRFALVEQLLWRHLVVFFRDQRPSLTEHRDFAARFGPLEVHPYLQKVDEAVPEVVRIDDTVRADSWHTDVTFSTHPPIGSVVHYAAGPDFGGDTMWSNQYLAYETLSPALRSMLDGLTAGHDSALYGNPQVQASHPVVRVHPHTGRRCLYVNRTWTHHINELSRPESDALLDFLFNHSEAPQFTCRWRWTPGDMAVWDNRATMHAVVNDFGTEPRMLHRCTVLGDDPTSDTAPAWPAHEPTSISAADMMPILSRRRNRP